MEDKNDSPKLKYKQVPGKGSDFLVGYILGNMDLVPQIGKPWMNVNDPIYVFNNHFAAIRELNATQKAVWGATKFVSIFEVEMPRDIKQRGTSQKTKMIVFEPVKIITKRLDYLHFPNHVSEDQMNIVKTNLLNAGYESFMLER